MPTTPQATLKTPMQLELSGDFVCCVNVSIEGIKVCVSDCSSTSHRLCSSSLCFDRRRFVGFFMAITGTLQLCMECGFQGKNNRGHGLLSSECSQSPSAVSFICITPDDNETRCVIDFNTLLRIIVLCAFQTPVHHVRCPTVCGRCVLLTLQQTLDPQFMINCDELKSVTRVMHSMSCSIVD